MKDGTTEKSGTTWRGGAPWVSMPVQAEDMGPTALSEWYGELSVVRAFEEERGHPATVSKASFPSRYGGSDSFLDAMAVWSGLADALLRERLKSIRYQKREAERVRFPPGPRRRAGRGHSRRARKGRSAAALC